MKQNITLSLDRALIRKAKIIAAQRDTSVSKMLRDELKRLIKQFGQYELSKKRAYANLKVGFHFGGKITATREELHER